MTKIKMKPCAICKTMPVLEHWSSDGPMYAVRCNNPDRPDSCFDGFYYSKSSGSEEAIKRWNEWQIQMEKKIYGIYNVNTPVDRPVWKNHEIIGYATLSRKDADFLNGIEGIGIYFGFTVEEHQLLNNGTENDLRKAGFIE